MKKRNLSAEENQKAEDMALHYMHQVADLLEGEGQTRPSELQLAAQAYKIAESTKRIWRLTPVSSTD